MVKRIGTTRRKTRRLYSKPIRKKGKVSMSRYFATYKDGDKVQLVTESSVQKGMFHPRFYGKAGVVAGKQGRCYYVTIKDRTKAKDIIVHPVHLKPLK